MSESNIESQYKKLIIHHISNINVCSEQRSALFLDFFQNSETYYDDLCDLLYCISSQNILAPIWMSHSGEVYSSTHRRSSNDIFIMDSYELPAFNGDLFNQFEYTFSKIYFLTNKAQMLRSCLFS